MNKSVYIKTPKKIPDMLLTNNISEFGKYITYENNNMKNIPIVGLSALATPVLKELFERRKWSESLNLSNTGKEWEEWRNRINKYIFSPKSANDLINNIDISCRDLINYAKLYEKQFDSYINNCTLQMFIALTLGYNQSISDPTKCDKRYLEFKEVIIKFFNLMGSIRKDINKSREKELPILFETGTNILDPILNERID